MSYAGAYARDRLEEEWKAYDRESFGLLADVDTQLSVAGTLFSPEIVEMLDAFYRDWLMGTFDREITEMATAQVDQASGTVGTTLTTGRLATERQVS